MYLMHITNYKISHNEYADSLPQIPNPALSITQLKFGLIQPKSDSSKTEITRPIKGKSLVTSIFPFPHNVFKCILL